MLLEAAHIIEDKQGSLYAQVIGMARSSWNLQ